MTTRVSSGSVLCSAIRTPRTIRLSADAAVEDAGLNPVEIEVDPRRTVEHADGRMGECGVRFQDNRRWPIGCGLDRAHAQARRRGQLRCGGDGMEEAERRRQKERRNG
jgi:hypothetical protein